MQHNVQVIYTREHELYNYTVGERQVEMYFRRVYAGYNGMEYGDAFPTHSVRSINLFQEVSKSALLRQNEYSDNIPVHRIHKMPRYLENIVLLPIHIRYI